jgi:hypothetical protein
VHGSFETFGKVKPKDIVAKYITLQQERWRGGGRAWASSAATEAVLPRGSGPTLAERMGGSERRIAGVAGW